MVELWISELWNRIGQTVITSRLGESLRLHRISPVEFLQLNIHWTYFLDSIRV